MRNNLKTLRKRMGLTQDQLAEAIGEKTATYGTWERGTTEFNVVQLLRCAEVLDCSCDAILGHEVGERYTDPMERALHMTWEKLDDHDRQMVLDVARNAAYAAQQRGETNTGRGDSVPAAS